MLTELNRDDKLRLLGFVCSFAWADLEIAESERKFVLELVGRLDLGEEDRGLVDSWLDHPPTDDFLDPGEVPKEHRKLFFDAVLEMVAADGDVDPMEVENLALFDALLNA